MHNVLKEEVGNELLDAATFLERAKERIFDAQQHEMVRVIRGIGEYKLVTEKKYLEVAPSRWIEMTKEQRQATVKKVLNMSDIEEVVPTFPSKLSMDFVEFSYQWILSNFLRDHHSQFIC